MMVRMESYPEEGDRLIMKLSAIVLKGLAKGFTVIVKRRTLDLLVNALIP